MPNTPKPEQIAATLAQLVAADLSTTAAIFAGMLSAVREAGDPAVMAAVKPGVTALRIEGEHWRKAYLAASKASGNGSNPLADLMAAGAAAMAKPAE